MFETKDAEARRDIEFLRTEIYKLRERLCYYTEAQKHVAENSVFKPCGTPINATEIVKRFDELYALLGVDRKTMPERIFLEKPAASNTEP